MGKGANPPMTTPAKHAPRWHVTAAQQKRQPESTIATHEWLPGFTAEWMFVTPDYAREWLALNVKNRPKRDRRIAGLVRQIRADEWELDCDPARFMHDGTLGNFQHRAYAVVEAEQKMQPDDPGAYLLKLGVPVLVTRGLRESARGTMDSNAGRSAGDNAEMNGIANGSAVSAVAKLVFQYESSDERGPAGSSTIQAQNPEVARTIDQHPEIVPIVAQTALWAKNNKSMRGFGPRVAAFSLLLFTQKDFTTGYEFMRSIWTGENISGDSPEMAFRNRFQETRSNPRVKNPSLNAQQLWIIAAWNAKHDGDGGYPVRKAMAEPKACAHRNAPVSLTAATRSGRPGRSRRWGTSSTRTPPRRAASRCPCRRSGWTRPPGRWR